MRFFLLPLREKVARKARRMRGLDPRRQTPHPSSLREATLSHKGRGKKSSIPVRRKAWIHAALVFRQAGDGFQIFIVEADIQRAEIGLLAFGARGLRDRSDIV